MDDLKNDMQDKLQYLSDMACGIPSGVAKSSVPSVKPIPTGGACRKSQPEISVPKVTVAGGYSPQNSYSEKFSSHFDDINQAIDRKEVKGNIDFVLGFRVESYVYIEVRFPCAPTAAL
jgi:hypothetical protein